MNSLAFWPDDLDCFYYIPDHKIVTREELFETYGLESTELVRCKAWWNTNIPMDKFVPTIIPCREGYATPDIGLSLFVERVKQRTIGQEIPVPPEFKIKPGILVLFKEDLSIFAVITKHPNDEGCRYNIIDSSGIPSSREYINEMILRDLNFLYWDMFEERYV